MRLSSTSAVVVALAICSLWPVANAADQTPSDLAIALQKKYDTVKDFSADFLHTYRGGVLNKQLTERGKLIIKKPGRMHWEYTAPERKLFVSDGVKIYSYLPDDKQVIVGPCHRTIRPPRPRCFSREKAILHATSHRHLPSCPRDFRPAAWD